MANPVDLAAILARRSGAGTKNRIMPSNFRQQEGPGQTAPLVRNVYPPYVYKLPTSQDYNENFFTSVLAAVVGAVVVPVEFILPRTYVGYQQIFGIYVLSPTALTDITFTLRINGAPVGGWDNIKPPPGVANFIVQNFSELQVRVPSGGKVDVLVTNDAATGPWTVGAKIAGWYHSEIEEQRIYGSV